MKAAAKPDSGLPGAIGGAVVLVAFLWWFTGQYTVSLQSPVRLHWQWPLVVAERVKTIPAEEARADQKGHRLSAWQQYACRKFGADCRVALAIQRAENPQGKCEIYHYNSNGTLDWGYFQINTVAESAGPAGLQGEYRFRMAVVPGEPRVHTLEHV